MDIKPIKNLNSWFQHAEEKLLIAGPCSAESEKQVLETAKLIDSSNQATVFRAGVWKPRTKPGSFEGIGVPALSWLKKVKQETNMLVSTEVASAFHVEQALQNDIDVLWIGARSTVNPFVIQEIAEALRGVKIPVFVKNPIHSELALWDGAIQRLKQVGVDQIAGIHRGFYSSNSKPFRNIPEWQIAVELKRIYPEMPVITDPSHIAGRRDLIESVMQTALDLNFDGFIVETHNNPDEALSDANQQITPSVLKAIVDRLKIRAEVSSSEDYLKQIELLRNDLNSIDEQLLNLLKKRVDSVTEIERFKRSHGLSSFEFSRLVEILNTRKERAKKLGLREDFVEELYNILFKNSFEISSSLREEKR